MQAITVRAETADDLKAIDVVHLSAFEGDDEVGFIDSLRGTSGYIPELSLVAEFNGRIVGHILLTRICLQQRNKSIDILALAPMAVVPSQSHRGIGSELVNTAIEEARKHGYKAVAVIGHPEFYQRFGFKHVSSWKIGTNISVDQDLVTAIELQQGILDDGGNLIYPSQFSQVY